MPLLFPTREESIMINRTLARIRVFQELFAFFHSCTKTVEETEAELRRALLTSHNLYLYLLDLVPTLTALHVELLDKRRKKLIKNDEDTNPNMRLADNRLAALLDNCDELSQSLLDANLSWRRNDALLKTLLDEILASELYKSYIANPNDSLDTDVDFWASALQRLVFKNPALDDYLEDSSIYWDNPYGVIEKIELEEMPDLDFLEKTVQELHGTQCYSAVRLPETPVEIQKDFALKTLRRVKRSKTVEELIMPLFKDREDEDFAFELLRSTINHADQFLEQINTALKNWESERLTDTDTIILQMGLAEMLTFPNIPATVTINEYIELAKNFSTAKSGSFVNGILDTLLKQFRKEERITK